MADVEAAVEAAVMEVEATEAILPDMEARADIQQQMQRPERQDHLHKCYI